MMWHAETWMLVAKGGDMMPATHMHAERAARCGGLCVLVVLLIVLCHGGHKLSGQPSADKLAGASSMAFASHDEIIHNRKQMYLTMFWRLKGTPSGHSSWPETVERVQIFPSAGFE